MTNPDATRHPSLGLRIRRLARCPPNATAHRAGQDRQIGQVHPIGWVRLLESRYPVVRDRRCARLPNHRGRRSSRGALPDRPSRSCPTRESSTDRHRRHETGGMNVDDQRTWRHLDVEKGDGSP